MRVFVMISKTGVVNSYECKEDSVESLKEAIFHKEGNVLVEHQRLTLEREPYNSCNFNVIPGMENHRTLSYYNVKEGSTVYLKSIRPLGGGCVIRGPLWKLAAFYVLGKKICRKCYSRLPPNAEKCHKANCHSKDIRWKKVRYCEEYIPKKLSDWNIGLCRKHP